MAWHRSKGWRATPRRQSVQVTADRADLMASEGSDDNAPVHEAGTIEWSKRHAMEEAIGLSDGL
jgi:hypothetical protein